MIDKPIKDCWVSVLVNYKDRPSELVTVQFDSQWKHCRSGKDDCTCNEQANLNACCCTHKSEYKESDFHKKQEKITLLNKLYEV